MASTVITRLIAKTEQHDSALATATASVNRYVDSITDVKGAVNAALGMMPQFLTAAGAVSALGGAIMQNIQTARDFEKSMSSLSSLTGMSGEALDQLKEKAIELGGSSTQSASQVVEAFQLIGSQKPELLKSQEALASVTKSAITLAEAAGMAVPEAAAALTGSLNQMGEGADKAEDYINILAAASQQGAGDINYLNTAITQSGATAKAVGLSYNQLVAALESIAEGGFDASTAGTALRNILLALESQTNNNFKPSVVGATEAIKNLRDANLSATDMMDMFGKQNMAVASTLISNAEKFDTLTESITGTNTATEQASINTDNLDGDLKALESAWEKLNLTINDGNGLIRPFVQFLTQVVDAMTDIYKATEPAREAIGSFCDSFEPIINTILPNIKGLLKDLREIANLMSSITDGDASAGAGIGAMGGRLITTTTENPVTPPPVNNNNNNNNNNKPKGKPKGDRHTYDAADYDTNTANLQAIYDAASKSASEYNEQLRISSDYYKDLAAETNRYADSIIKTTDGKLTEEQAAQVAELRKTAEGYSDLSKKCGELASKEEALKAIQLQDELKGQQDSTIRLQENIKALQDELQLLTVGSDEYKAKVQEIKDAQTDLSERTRDYADGSLADLNAKLSEAREYLSNATIGSQEYAEALAQVRDLTLQLNDAQTLQQDSMRTSSEVFADNLSAANSLWGSVTNLESSFTSLASTLTEGANAWEVFKAMVSAALTVLNTINTVTTVFKGIQTAATAATAADTAATTANTAATSAEAAAEVAANTAIAASSKPATAGQLAQAAATYAAAHAYIPFAGAGIAAGFTAQAVAQTGSAYAAGLAFANGGVVPGNSWQGDRLFARVNSGETILNTDQAAYLNDQLDSIESTGMQTPTARSVVTGEQLYQTITNWGRRTGKGELLFG